MGWDAFGLPVEQYAPDTGNDPRDFTKLISTRSVAKLKILIFMIGIVK